MIYDDKKGHNGHEGTEQGVGYHIEVITFNGWCAGWTGGDIRGLIR